MGKLIIILLTTLTLGANNFVNVDCSAFNEVYENLKGISKKCEVSTEIHTFTQEIDKNVAGIIRYENGEEVPFTTENNIFNVNIEQNRKFKIRIGQFTSVFMKLSILKDGSESWKYLKPITSRWNKYTFKKLIITMVSVDHKILFENLKPMEGTKFQYVGDMFLYEDVSDSNGTVDLKIPINTSYTFRGWNPVTKKWFAYKNLLKTNINREDFMLINGEWVKYE